MAKHKIIRWISSDKLLKKDFERLRGTKWSAKPSAVKKMRKRLLELQNYRCAYCQAAIVSDTNGQREIDHILPKDASAHVDMEKARSDVFENRRHTEGYKQFTWKVSNLAISCKPCNSNKGTFDPRLNREKSSSKVYPKSNLLWVHPHYCRYDDHITVDTSNFIYKKITDEGDAVIRACKLDDVTEVERRLVDQASAVLFQHKTGRSAIMQTLLNVFEDKYSIDHALAAICARHGLAEDIKPKLRSLIAISVGRSGLAPSIVEIEEIIDIITVKT